MSLLDQANLPYKKEEAAPAPATTLSPTPTPAPAPVPSGTPATSILSGANLPFKPGDKPASTQPQGDSPLWTALQKPTTSIADLWDAAKLTGQGVGDYARVFGNNAIVPNALDRGLSMMPWSGGLEAEKAKTKAAETDLGSFAAVPKWQGQNYGVSGITNRFVGGPLSSVANNPITQGVVTGGGGTIMGGDYNPEHILKNAATSALESKAGQAIGSGLSAATSFVGNQGKVFYKKAQDEVAAAVNAGDIPGWRAAMQKVGNIHNLQDLYHRGGDIAAQASDLASQATGAAADAYQHVADAASQGTKTGKWADRATTAVLGGLTGGPVAANVALGANEFANMANKYANVRGSIDDALARVTGYVNNAVDPQVWQNAGASAARVAGGDYKALSDKIRTFSPSAAIRSTPVVSTIGSWLGY